ncbi:hypothetical protein F4818DRAFT_443175 [Hypoxylon cercidicola]|nr:hypothetical protein F4818DRAFT_443175 [Hypoxylon cercidicola]
MSSEDVGMVEPLGESEYARHIDNAEDVISAATEIAPETMAKYLALLRSRMKTLEKEAEDGKDRIRKAEEKLGADNDAVAAQLRSLEQSRGELDSFRNTLQDTVDVNDKLGKLADKIADMDRVFSHCASTQQLHDGFEQERQGLREVLERSHQRLQETNQALEDASQGFKALLTSVAAELHQKLGEGSKRKKKSKGKGKARDKEMEEYDEILSDVGELMEGESKRMSTAISLARGYAKEHFPAMTKERFETLAPSYPPRFTHEEYEAARTKWKADPLRYFLLGHSRGPREAFQTVYRTILRYYNCLYEDFIGPRFQLRYDNSDNSKFVLDEDADVKQLIRDPFPSKAFSKSLNCLLSQPIWRGHLDRLATCLQFVNILRTNDKRPWHVADCDPESRFFRTWQRVVRDNLDTGNPIELLFAEVKERIGDQGHYCALFDQIVKSVESKRRSYIDHDSKRTADDDPYFIKVVDLNMLTHALDNMSHLGMPFSLSSAFLEAALKLSRRDPSYPRQSQYVEARDNEIIYTRMIREKVAADPDTKDDIPDIPQDDEPSRPTASASEQPARVSDKSSQGSNSTRYSGGYGDKDRRAEVGYVPSPSPIPPRAPSRAPSPTEEVEDRPAEGQSQPEPKSPAKTDSFSQSTERTMAKRSVGKPDVYTFYGN